MHFLRLPAIHPPVRPARHHNISVIPAPLPPFSIPIFPESPPRLHPLPLSISSFYLFLPSSSSSSNLSRNHTHYFFWGGITPGEYGKYEIGVTGRNCRCLFTPKAERHCRLQLRKLCRCFQRRLISVVIVIAHKETLFFVLP